MTSRTLAVMLLGACSLSAQVFVVDAANGPGTNYTEISAAVAAVPDGATLLVRPGAYADFTISGKGLTVLGDGANVVDTNGFGSIVIQLTAPTQAVILRGVGCQAGNLSINNCAGRVVLEDLTAAVLQLPNDHPRGGRIAATGCAQLLLHDVTATEITITNSTASLRGCHVGVRSSYSINAWLGPLHFGATPGMTVDNSSVELQDSTILQGFGFSASYAAPAITVSNSALRILSGTSWGGITWPLSTFPNPSHTSAAILGSGNLRIDPATVFEVGSHPNTSVSPPPLYRDMPELFTASAPLGGTITTTLDGVTGHLAILAIGLPGAPAPYPGIADPLWLDPNVWVFEAIGQAPLTVQKAVPSNVGFLGLGLMWQGVTFDPSTGLLATNPGLSVLY